MPILKLNLEILNNKLAVCRLQAGTPLPKWALEGDFTTITRTVDELSVVCDDHLVPEGTQKEGRFKAIKVVGPLDFSLIGILSNLSTLLAEAGISLFAISTYDTDYLLVREAYLNNAIEALAKAGHQVVGNYE